MLGSFYFFRLRFGSVEDEIVRVLIDGSDIGKDVHGFLYHRILHGLEFLVVHERYSFGKVLGVDAEYLLTLFVPQVIEGSDPFVGRQLNDDSIDECLHIGFQIAVLFLTACMIETVSKFTKHFFHLRVIVHTGVDLLHDLGDELTAMGSQFIPMLGLPCIDFVQVVLEDIPCQ